MGIYYVLVILMEWFIYLSDIYLRNVKWCESVVQIRSFGSIGLSVTGASFGSSEKGCVKFNQSRRWKVVQQHWIPQINLPYDETSE